MQSYEQYVVSEFLNDRHPYLQGPFTSEINPQQVTLAVFDRSIPKLSEVIHNVSVPSQKHADALRTLNELVSHQETKDEIIDNDVIKASSLLLNSSDPRVRKEAVSLLGSISHLQRGRDKMDPAFGGMKKLLTDEEDIVKEVDAWAIMRLSQSRDGCELIVKSKIENGMVDAANKYLRHKEFKTEYSKYFLYLFEAFVNLTEYDQGIYPILPTGLIKRLVKILKKKYKNNFGHITKQIKELVLKILGNVSVNHNGKEEGVKCKVIKGVWKYLNSSILNEKVYASLAIMNLTIHLKGKKQAVKFEKMDLPAILIALINKLLEKHEPLRNNCKIALLNISELPKGFLKIVEHIADKIDIMDELLGFRAIRGLAELLPFARDLKNHLFTLDPSKVAKYNQYIQGILHFYKKADEIKIKQSEEKKPGGKSTDKDKPDEALKITIDWTIDLPGKLAIFLNPNYKIQQAIIWILKKMCKKDENSCYTMRRFIEEFGKIEFARQPNNENTTIISELSSLDPELLEIINTTETVLR